MAGVALVVAAVAYLTGPYKSARCDSRRFLARAGHRATGRATPFGHWVAENKPLRVGVILVLLAVFLLWSSPSLTVLIVLRRDRGRAAARDRGPRPGAADEYGTPTSVT